MKMIRYPDWAAAYPRWHVWHTILLYASALALALFGCASVWGGFQMVPDRFSPRHVVGIPFVALGVGLLLRAPAFIWLTSGLCVAFFALVCGGQLRQLAFFGTRLNPAALLMASGALLYAITMIRGITGRGHSTQKVDPIN